MRGAQAATSLSRVSLGLIFLLAPRIQARRAARNAPVFSC
jgi:hypothetical protein